MEFDNKLSFSDFPRGLGNRLESSLSIENQADSVSGEASEPHGGAELRVASVKLNHRALLERARET